MEISRKTDYALRMMATLAKNPDSILSTREAAEQNEVPYSFARSIQHDLVLAGIISSVRGSHGGMRLAVDPSQITLFDLVEAVQGPIEIASCKNAVKDGGPCPRIETCSFNAIWCGACAILADYFSSVTLDQIVNGTGDPSLSKKFFEPDAFKGFCRKDN